MIIEIIRPSDHLEKDILTFVPVTNRFKSESGYYIETYHVTQDPFTDRIDIFIHTEYIKMDIHFINRIDCDDVLIHKGGI